ncbi:MAG: EI24 domain-containing protein [Lentisphaeria bacterium]|nr:EI24 domain-containing protein [Lentisphaeria bacterium]
MIGSMIDGAAAVFRGIKLFFLDRGAWRYALAPWLMLALIYAALAGLMWYSADTLVAAFAESMPEWLSALTGVILRIGVLTLSLFLLPLLTLVSLYELCGWMLADLLAGYWNRSRFGWNHRRTPGEFRRFMLKSAWFSIKAGVKLLLPALLGLLFPLLGQALLFLYAGYLTAIAALGTTAFLYGVDFEVMRRRARRDPAVWGFGLTAYALLLFPLLPLIILPGIIIGGAELFHSEMEEELLTASRPRPTSAGTP